MLQLLLAAGAAEGGGGAAHVVDIALKARVLDQQLGLPNHALVAAGGDGAPLVEGQGAEVAGPEAAPVVGDGEADLLDGGHAAHVVIHGVGLPHIGQLGHPVQFLGGQGIGGGIDDEKALAVPLDDGLAHGGVVLLILHHIGLGIGPFGGGHLFKGGNLHPGIGAHPGVVGGHAGAPHVGDLAHRGAGVQPGGDVQGGRLPHAIGEDIRLGIEEDGAADLVLPIVIVGEAAQRCLQPADDDGDVPKGLPHPVGIDHGGVVGAQPGFPSGGIGVVVAALAGGGVVGHHRVDVACGDEHPQPGAAHGTKRLRPPPVRLGQNGHPIALRLQQPPDDGGAEGGVVHIGVPSDEQKVIVLPAPALHVCQADGKEQVAVKLHDVPLFFRRTAHLS